MATQLGRFSHLQHTPRAPQGPVSETIAVLPHKDYGSTKEHVAQYQIMCSRAFNMDEDRGKWKQTAIKQRGSVVSNRYARSYNTTPEHTVENEDANISFRGISRDAVPLHGKSPQIVTAARGLLPVALPAVDFDEPAAPTAPTIGAVHVAAVKSKVGSLSPLTPAVSAANSQDRVGMVLAHEAREHSVVLLDPLHHEYLGWDADGALCPYRFRYPQAPLPPPPAVAAAANIPRRGPLGLFGEAFVEVPAVPDARNPKVARVAPEQDESPVSVPRTETKRSRSRRTGEK